MFKYTNAYEVHINNSPLLIMTPHSGRNYDKEFLKHISLNIRQLRNTEDFCVDQLGMSDVTAYEKHQCLFNNCQCVSMFFFFKFRRKC